ncbi:hypothetical protein B0H14DRAFT_2555982 [Mycena olivaceomarginata]|nr:hypothetical protein B0H14DRAFT_2555982 [Mycena olivaceomarginata]
MLPFTMLLSTLMLPLLGCLPDGRLISVGVFALAVYQLAFLVVFGRHQFSILVHGTNAEHPVHILSLLYSATGSSEAGPSRPDRGKANNFFKALDDGAAELEPTKHKHKQTDQTNATKKQDDDDLDGL